MIVILIKFSDKSITLLLNIKVIHCSVLWTSSVQVYVMFLAMCTFSTVVFWTDKLQSSDTIQ